MKKLLLLLMFATSAFAQQKEIEVMNLTREMKCAKTEDLMLFITGTFGEKMVWVGKDENNASYVALYKNTETGTWSLIQYGAAVACFLSSGSQGSPT